MHPRIPAERQSRLVPDLSGGAAGAFGIRFGLHPGLGFRGGALFGIGEFVRQGYVFLSKIVDLAGKGIDVPVELFDILVAFDLGG